jgi:hypothetical protein
MAAPETTSYPPAIMSKAEEIKSVSQQIEGLQEQITSLRAGLEGIPREDPAYNAASLQITTVVNRMTAIRESREALKAELSTLLQRYGYPEGNLKKLI